MRLSNLKLSNGQCWEEKCRPKLFSISAVKYKPAFQKNSKYILRYYFQSAWVMNKMFFFHSVACFCLFRVLFFYFFWTWMFLRWVPWRRAMSPSRRTECLFFSFPSQSVTTQQNTGREWTYRLAGVFNSWEKESVLRSHAARSSFPNIEKYLSVILDADDLHSFNKNLRLSASCILFQESVVIR